MTPEEKQQIDRLNQALKNTIYLKLRIAEDRQSNELKTFAQELAQRVQKINLSIEQKEAHEPPAMEITPNLIYHAVPHGTEFHPFISILAAVSSQPIDQAQDANDNKSDFPAMFKLYVSGMCPNCPVAVNKLFPLSLQSKAVRIAIIDATWLTELSSADQIRSVPTLILDDQFRWTGSLDMEEILNTIKNRDPAELSTATLATMIADGGAYRLADMMLSDGTIFPAFIDLLVNDAFSIRLGAMAAAEEIADQRLELAVRLVEPLWDRFDAQTDAVKGDIVYVMGLTGDQNTLDILTNHISGGCSEDVKEAAEEAIAEIRSRL